MLRMLHVILHDGWVHRKLIELRIGRGTGRHREQRYLLVLLHFMRGCSDIWILHLGLLWTVLCNRMEARMRRWRLSRSERLLLSLVLRSHGRVHVERPLLQWMLRTLLHMMLMLLMLLVLDMHPYLARRMSRWR